MSESYTTHEVAQMAEIHRDTLLRWLREGRIPEPGRNRNGWRAFTRDEVQNVVQYAKSGLQPVAAQSTILKDTAVAYAAATPLTNLYSLDWDFADAKTGYLTHSLHPYPAKYIPQIPNALIQELSSVGDTVLDPFCGSGTTLVEALLLKRNAIGVDANPLACMIARAKTAQLDETGVTALRCLAKHVDELSLRYTVGLLPLFPNLEHPTSGAPRPNFDGLDFWFDAHVIDELSELKALCLNMADVKARDIALTVFSSIIVTVSRQDSDTRYVRREKQTKPGEAIQRFARALDTAILRVSEFADLIEPRFRCEVFNANVLDAPPICPVDLVVCSPPYPNAYSYHLYHRTRMLWLDMDQPAFKQAEIGSHRKYSKKGSGAADVNTFRAELGRILDWLRGLLRPGKYACFVVGDSTLRGETIHNDQVLAEVAAQCNYAVEANLTRRMQDSRKSFNPAIGKVKDEHIVILRNRG